MRTYWQLFVACVNLVVMLYLGIIAGWFALSMWGFVPEPPHHTQIFAMCMGCIGAAHTMVNHDHDDDPSS